MAATLSRATPDPAAAAVDAGLAFFCYFRAELRTRKPGGLSMPQFRALSILAKEPDRSLGDIAEDLGVSPPALSKMADALVERGLLDRAADAVDRRRVTLALTPAGARLVAGFRRDLEEGLAARMAALPARSRTAIAMALQDLQAVLAPQVAA
ncbi:MAG TPA: MarR family transcriptional regulator [Candidatus Thermoplasmatota archaeon]|nr:MarR family transcriptional regulator [Candidatus Thermoplasmatota archaeon]